MRNGSSSEETFARSAVKFAVNVAVCYALGYGMARGLMRLLEPWSFMSSLWWERLSKLVGMGLYTVLNYFGQRFFAFRRGRETRQP